LVYDATITGRNDGSLLFEAIAEPLTDVLTNRTGFIVLHPVEGVAGRPVQVLHVDGREENARFPDVIDPMCPFQDIRALTHEVKPGTSVTCTMEGDTFEMEDQRNWSDASYKTYVRPLARPWPYTLPKGEKIRQAVRLTVNGPLPLSATAGGGKAVSVTLGGESGRLPAIGLGVPAEEAEPALANIDLVKRLGPKWLVCQVDLRAGHGRREFDLYRRLGEATGADIVLEIVTSGGMDAAADLTPLAASATAAGLKPAAVAVFPAQDLKSVLPGSPWPEMPSFAAIYAAARKAFPGVKLGGGMATYFTELNRKRPPPALLDFVTNTTCPNVHAADDRSVMETMEALSYQLLSTRSFMGALPTASARASSPAAKTPTARPWRPTPTTAASASAASTPASAACSTPPGFSPTSRRLRGAGSRRSPWAHRPGRSGTSIGGRISCSRTTTSSMGRPCTQRSTCSPGWRRARARRWSGWRFRIRAPLTRWRYATAPPLCCGSRTRRPSGRK